MKAGQQTGRWDAYAEPPLGEIDGHFTRSTFRSMRCCGLRLYDDQAEPRRQHEHHHAQGRSRCGSDTCDEGVPQGG